MELKRDYDIFHFEDDYVRCERHHTLARGLLGREGSQEIHVLNFLLLLQMMSKLHAVRPYKASLHKLQRRKHQSVTHGAESRTYTSVRRQNMTGVRHQF